VSSKKRALLDILTLVYIFYLFYFEQNDERIDDERGRPFNSLG